LFLSIANENRHDSPWDTPYRMKKWLHFHIKSYYFTRVPASGSLWGTAGQGVI
jgi:hypothetical protein